MPDIVLNIGLWWAPVLALAIILHLSGLSKLRWSFLILGFAVSVVYIFTVLRAGQFIPLDDYIPGLQWNWSGKLASFAMTLLVLAVLSVLLREVTPARAGFRLKQEPGSVWPALLLIAACIGLMVVLTIQLGGGPQTSPERLAYQATMPGLDEEPHYRGLLLLLLNEAFGGKKIRILGAPIGWGGLAIVLIFGLGHGAGFNDGQFVFSAISVGVTGFLGLALLWVRERTGSLVMPIIGHNAINFVPSFF